MQLIHQKQNTIEKIIRDGDGRLVRATFSIYESHGRIKARLLTAVFLDEHTVIANPVLKLGGFISNKELFLPREALAKWRSPYFSNSFYISGSQPRAPTYTK